MPARKSLTDEEIARRCVNCTQGKWAHGTHYCLRKTCKYRTSQASSWFIRKERGG